MPLEFQIKNDDTEILVWYLTEPEEWFEKKIQLTENEFNKFKLISNQVKRVTFYALRWMLKEHGINQLKYKENGKPEIKNGYISISHSGPWVVIKMSKKQEIGVDIEKISERILKIKNRFLSETEIEIICKNSIEKMILCWSAKEAIFKKHGGDTVFFKEKISVLDIDEEKKQISVEFENKTILTSELLSFWYPDKEYVLVHTL
jgi:4'-phosphopantetheinyl transferase